MNPDNDPEPPIAAMNLLRRILKTCWLVIRPLVFTLASTAAALAVVIACAASLALIVHLIGTFIIEPITDSIPPFPHSLLFGVIAGALWLGIAYLAKAFTNFVISKWHETK